MRARRPRGVTLLEVLVVVAIVAIVTMLAYTSLARFRPRANAANAASELQALLNGARQQALATGHDVAVLVFPTFDHGRGTGRIVLYEDGNFDLFSDAAAVNFAAYDVATTPHGDRSEVLATVDLPRGVAVGPATGLGASKKLVQPYDRVDVTKACAFCKTSGDARGAIRFDGRGQATFYAANGAAQVLPAGSSFTITSSEVGGTTTFVITATTGSVVAIGGS